MYVWSEGRGCVVMEREERSVSVCVMDNMNNIYHNICSSVGLSRNHSYLYTRGELAGRKDVFEVLHPFVTDTSLVMQQRMAVLELMEKVSCHVMHHCQ